MPEIINSILNFSLGLAESFVGFCIDVAWRLVAAFAVFIVGYKPVKSVNIYGHNCFYKLFEFLEDYKFGRLSREEYSIVYNTIYDCDLLIIDDFGTEFITSYTQSVFFDLLNTRLINGKSTVISTNLNFDKLNDIYGERVISRLQNEFTGLFFCGKDIRFLKNE